MEQTRIDKSIFFGALTVIGIFTLPVLINPEKGKMFLEAVGLPLFSLQQLDPVYCTGGLLNGPIIMRRHLLGLHLKVQRLLNGHPPMEFSIGVF